MDECQRGNARRFILQDEPDRKVYLEKSGTGEVSPNANYGG